MRVSLLVWVKTALTWCNVLDCTLCKYVRSGAIGKFIQTRFPEQLEGGWHDCEHRRHYLPKRWRNLRLQFSSKAFVENISIICFEWLFGIYTWCCNQFDRIIEGAHVTERMCICACFSCIAACLCVSLSLCCVVQPERHLYYLPKMFIWFDATTIGLIQLVVGCVSPFSILHNTDTI